LGEAALFLAEESATSGAEESSASARGAGEEKNEAAKITANIHCKLFSPEFKRLS
jgi:hypothetical protein